MTKVTKITMGIVGTLTLICVLAAGAVVLWFAFNKAAWQKQGAAAIAEGSAAGKQSTCDECVALAIRRLPTGTGAEFRIVDQVRVQFYLKGCLQEAKGTLPYCGDAPPATDLLKSAAWRQETYQSLSLPAGGNAANNPIVLAIQEHCAATGAAKP